MKRTLKTTFGVILLFSPIIVVLVGVAIDKGIVSAILMIAAMLTIVGIVFIGAHLLATADD